MIKAVIFDLDDTISLTEAVSFEIENNIIKSMGRPPMSREIHLSTWELSPAKALPIRSPGTDIDGFMTAYAKKLNAYVESGKLDQIPIKNFEALDKLIKRNKKLFILTSRTHARVKHLLDPRHPLASRINKFYYRENLDFRKPNPKVFTKLLQENDLQPQQCVYVGDSLRDASAAKGAGLYFIAVLESGLRQRKDFDSIPVDTYISTLADIVPAIESIDT